MKTSLIALVVCIVLTLALFIVGIAAAAPLAILPAVLCSWPLAWFCGGWAFSSFGRSYTIARKAENVTTHQPYQSTPRSRSVPLG
ncbi:MAG: hypothetical protein J0M33_23775 [Anaerolineae bacterium]|nr:hypothetical protein [Anaerolineae bacterium]